MIRRLIYVAPLALSVPALAGLPVTSFTIGVDSNARVGASANPIKQDPANDSLAAFFGNTAAPCC